ncbi:MAG: hypothetical protein LQ338_007255 [Usnochroma carphineum]|nr:MAG: hypothetical protein LQ338_007255 [Usnochroma carphineum]
MAISCIICSQPNAQLCGKCRSGAYCSVECQQTDWPAHKLLCPQFSVLSDRPGPGFRRAILFPEEGPNPVVFWIDFHPTSTYETAELEKIMGDETLTFAYNDHNYLRDRDFGGILKIYSRDDYVRSGSMVNKSISLVTKGKNPYCWKGPLVVSKTPTLSQDLHDDITMTDFRNMIDFFMTYGLNRQAEAMNHPLKHKAKGVKVNCYGDIKRFNKKYVAVDVPKDHPVYLAKPSPIFALVGMAVKAQRYPFNKIWEDMPHSGVFPWSNGTAALLQMKADPRNPNTMGLAPLNWQSRIGNILVVREDKGDITPAEVEMLCDFCRYKMLPLIEESLQSDKEWISKEDGLMAQLTPAGFRRYIDEEHNSNAMNELRIRDAARIGYDLPPLEST